MNSKPCFGSYKQCVFKKLIFFRLPRSSVRPSCGVGTRVPQESIDSCQTASKSIPTSSAAVAIQEATNRDQALSFFQDEPNLQNARTAERCRVREGAFGKLPACPVRPTYGSTIFIITEIFKYMLWVIAYYWDTSRD